MADSAEEPFLLLVRLLQGRPTQTGPSALRHGRRGRPWPRRRRRLVSLPLQLPLTTGVEPLSRELSSHMYQSWDEGRQLTPTGKAQPVGALSK